MRLIDLDALGIGKCNPDVFDDKGYAKGWNSAIEILKNAPTVDAVEVVRCKDCIYYQPQPRKSVKWVTKALYCTRCATIKMPPNGYCSCGKRKGGDE